MASTATPICSVDLRPALGDLCARHLSEQQRAALVGRVLDAHDGDEPKSEP